jgi:hypothetical protein
MFKTWQSTKQNNYFNDRKTCQLLMKQLLVSIVPGGLAPPIYVSSALTDSGLVRFRFTTSHITTYNGQISEPTIVFEHIDN